MIVRPILQKTALLYSQYGSVKPKTYIYVGWVEVRNPTLSAFVGFRLCAQPNLQLSLTPSLLGVLYPAN
jgi:hypothetical protein